MALFDSKKLSERRGEKETVYQSVKNMLKQKDGKLHVLAVSSSCSNDSYMFVPEEKYTEQIETIIHSMQNDGYVIVDIKTSALHGINGTIGKVHTMIMYK